MIVGVELLPERVRAVALDRWRRAPRKPLELAWDPVRPADVVAYLRSELGPASRIGLSVGLGFLHPKHVKLPPAPAPERRRMLALEPDRFFPVQDRRLVVSLLADADLAFAADAELLEGWIAAFEQWAPVDSVEPAPLSVARALGAGESGTFELSAGPGEHGLLELDAGRVRAVRRIPGGSPAPALRPLPSRAGVPGELLAALGAARGVDAPPGAMLLPDAAAAAVRRRRLLRLALAAAACLASAAMAVQALDRSRDRTLERIASELEAVAPRAAGGMELQRRLAELEREATSIGQLAGARQDALRVLAALGGRLPAGAAVLNATASAGEWRIDGTARDAAALVPLLAADDLFEDVRAVSASSRFREAGRTYETFSIAFRVRSAS